MDWTTFFSAFGAFLCVVLPAVGALILQLRGLHKQMNSRLDEVVALTRKVAHEAGRREGLAEQQQPPPLRKSKENDSQSTHL